MQILYKKGNPKGAFWDDLRKLRFCTDFRLLHDWRGFWFVHGLWLLYRLAWSFLFVGCGFFSCRFYVGFDFCKSRFVQISVFDKFLFCAPLLCAMLAFWCILIVGLFSRAFLADGDFVGDCLFCLCKNNFSLRGVARGAKKILKLHFPAFRVFWSFFNSLFFFLENSCDFFQDMLY